MEIIMIIKFLILGIVQGITEPLPISSSGHIAIVSNILGINLQGEYFLTFAAFINFGSTLAIIIYFYKDIKWLFLGGIKYITSKFKATEESKYLWNIFYSTLPLVIATIIMEVLHIEIQDDLIYIGVALFFTGLMLMLVSKKNGEIKVNRMTKIGALIIGLAQVIALLPGISRSGITMCALLFLGFDKKDSFNYSFLMFIPASFGALFYSLYKIFQFQIHDQIIIISLLLSTFLSFIFTLIGL